jgi:hypothetical protein
MPAYSWGIFNGTHAALGMDVSQSGRTLRVTMYRQRNASSTFYNDPNGTITVRVNGSSAQGGASASNAFPTSLTVGTWYTAALVNASFTLDYGVSNAQIVVAWSYPTGSFASGSKTINRAVTPFYDAPAAPTDVTATRISDTSASLAWTRNATTDAPYTSQEAYRSENGGAPIDTASLSGSASSYTITTAANRKYTFTIQARNSAGSTDSDASSVLLTTPAALTSLAGAIVDTGIRLTFSKLLVPYTEAQVLLEVTTDGGDTWSTVHTFDATDLSTTTSTAWIDTDAPTSGTVQYRATVKTNGGTQGTLSSAVTLSNEMVLNVPPGAPTNLAPSGLVDVASPIVLSWEHTPSSDGAAQSSRQVHYSIDSGSTQTDIVSGNSTAESYSWTVDTDDFSAGETVQWRVRTAGSEPGTYGDWSAWQTITLRQSLSVSVTDPSGTWEGGDITVEWTATAAWGSASQVAYRITMTDGTTTYDSGTITSATASGTIPASAQRNLTDYTVTVTVTDNYGLTSLPASTTVSTDFLEPGTVGLTWEYDDGLGQLVLTPAFDDETSSAFDDTVAWMLERSLDQATWEQIGTFTGDDPVSDGLVRIGADSWYRTTGYTSLGVAGEQTVYTIPASDVQSRWGWVSYGDGFGTLARFGWSQTVEIDSGRASDVYDIEGVDFPAAVFGEQQSEKFAVSGKLLYGDSVPERLATASSGEMRNVGKLAGVSLFRDGDGEYWTCRITDMKVTPAARAVKPTQAGVSFTIERVTA